MTDSTPTSTSPEPATLPENLPATSSPDMVVSFTGDFDLTCGITVVDGKWFINNLTVTPTVGWPDLSSGSLAYATLWPIKATIKDTVALVAVEEFRGRHIAIAAPDCAAMAEALAAIDRGLLPVGRVRVLAEGSEQEVEREARAIIDRYRSNDRAWQFSKTRRGFLPNAVRRNGRRRPSKVDLADAA